MVILELYGVSIDCPDVINLAIGLILNLKSPSLFTTMKNDCCTATGVTCSSQRVTQIFWFRQGLNGTINGTALPSGLFYLGLYNNLLTGPIPTLPSLMTTLALDDNNLSGDLPLFPSTMSNIHLGFPNQAGNHFTGTLRLNRPTNVYINDNWITDVIIQDTSQLTTCDLSNNPLLGNPRIVSLIMCTQNSLYSASQLPITKFTSKNIATTTSSLNSDSPSYSVDPLTGSTNYRYSVDVVATSTGVLIDILSKTESLTESTSQRFVVILMPLTINLRIVIHWIIDLAFLMVVGMRAPFNREFQKIGKRTQKTDILL